MMPVLLARISRSRRHPFIQADLAAVSAGIFNAQASTDATAAFGPTAGAVKCQRMTPKHGADKPARIAVCQQNPCGLKLLFGELAVVRLNLIHKQPRDGVRNHSHLVSFEVGDGYARQGASDPLPQPSVTTEAKAARRPAVGQGVLLAFGLQQMAPSEAAHV